MTEKQQSVCRELQDPSKKRTQLTIEHFDRF